MPAGGRLVTKLFQQPTDTRIDQFTFECAPSHTDALGNALTVVSFELVQRNRFVDASVSWVKLCHVQFP